MNYGFKLPTITPDNYVLGKLGVTKRILNPERDWFSFLPLGEIQKRNIETASCTEYGTLNAIEILENRQFSKKSNYSERFVAIGAKNTEDGNDPHTVAEWIRHNGLVNEQDLPFTDQIKSWQDYISPNLSPNLILKALQWLKQNLFKHEWVFENNVSLVQKQLKLLEALQYSPIGVSVNAWYQENDIYVKRPGSLDNPWTVLIPSKQNQPWTVYDSYLDDGQYIKKLDWNYDFQFAKLYVISTLQQKTFIYYLKRYWEELSKKILGRII